LRIRALIPLAALAAVLAAPSSAAAITDSVSQNWAGYAATGAHYERVSGSWVVPAVHCTVGRKSYSGAWVGLGGFSSSSQALEQIGTDQNCGKRGRTKYSAWYELIPNDPVTVKMAVQPGDKISASVTVKGHTVKLHVKNRSRKTAFSATKHMSAPDVSSADWIVEAPSSCDVHNNCSTVRLADFGTIPFASAFATAQGGHARGISKGGWSVTRMRLSDPDGGGATTSGLTSNGTVFKIKYRDQARSQRLSKASHGVGRRPA
jgi:peptidase A4-like protein